MRPDSRRSEALRAALGGIVGRDAVLMGDAVRPYLADGTELEGVIGTAEAVVTPSEAEAVAATVDWCYTRGVPVFPRGGGTGYAGGCVPHGGVVISTERLTKTRWFDPLGWSVEVEAGVTTRRLQDLARSNGLYYPVDPGAAEQSHVGGNAATNAGGPHAFKYGVTRFWMTGVEVVLAPGRLVRLGSSTRKDVAGYDLLSLLVGSEGTLGIITALCLRLIPAVEARLPVVGLFDSVDAGTEAMRAAMACGAFPSALEYLDRATLEMAGGAFPGDVPANAAFALIAEADGSYEEATAGRESLLVALADATAVHAPVEAGEVKALWRWREGVSLAVASSLGGKMSEDIAVPLHALRAAIEGTAEIGARHGLRACSWGHAGDGNLHSTFVFDRTDASAVAKARAATADLFQLAIDLGGTISGEHGIGETKTGWLRKQWPAEAFSMHQGIKSLFDPAGLLNPGKKT